MVKKDVAVRTVESIHGMNAAELQTALASCSMCSTSYAPPHPKHEAVHKLI